MKRKYLILFSISGLVLSCDQLTKHLVHSILPLDYSRSVIKGFITFVHEQSNGFAFGLLKKAPVSLQEIFFIAIPVFALVLIVLIFIKLRDDQMLTSVALTTIFSGALGNLLDRLKYGYVVDFLKIHFSDYFSFPPFNIADCSIIVGVALMFWNTWKQEPLVGAGESATPMQKDNV